MPFPRNWSEELISEWLSLKGYSTEIGLPVGVSSRGGRKEADVVGIKMNGTNLEIYHIEVGELGGNHTNNIIKLKDKFSSTRVDEICNRYKTRMAFTGSISYQKLYVDIWTATTRKVSLLNADGGLIMEKIRVWTLKELFDEIILSTKTWTPGYKSKSTWASLPESYWMLKLVEALREWEMLP